MVLYQNCAVGNTLVATAVAKDTIYINATIHQFAILTEFLS